MKKFYKINMYNTCLEPFNIPDDEAKRRDLKDNKGYFRNKHKAKYVMFNNRLENEFDKKRRLKLIKKINEILETYPEAII